MKTQEDFEITPKSGESYTVRVHVDLEKLARILGPRARKSKEGSASLGKAAIVVRELYRDSASDGSTNKGEGKRR